MIAIPRLSWPGRYRYLFDHEKSFNKLDINCQRVPKMYHLWAPPNVPFQAVFRKQMPFACMELVWDNYETTIVILILYDIFL